MSNALASSVEQQTGFESTIDYDEMLDLIMGHSDEYPRRPDEYSGYGTDETGQAYQNYELMSNEERKAAWDEWYQAVDAYGYDNLNGTDAMAYVATGYRLGYLTAEEADEMYDAAWAEYATANGWELQDDGVTWRKERDGGGGRAIVETKTQPSFADGYFGEAGAWDGNIGESLGPGTWTDSGLNPLLHQENYTREVEEPGGLRGAFNTIMQDIAPVVIKGTLTWAVGQALSPLIIGKLTAVGLSTAQATAVASAVSSQVANGFINGEVSLEGALTSGLGGYLSAGGISELLGDSAGALSGLTDTLDEALQLGTGSEFIGAMVRAGGTNALMQFALTGEIDPLQLASSLAQAGLTSELSQVIRDGMESGQIDEDDFDAWMEEQDGLDQEFINADIKDPFLNPNYEYVSGDNSLMVNTETGEVFNNDGTSMGQMADLDVDGDGVLNANDLQEVTVNAEPILDETDQFNSQYAPPSNTTNPTLFTEEWMEERYGNLTDEQVITAMQQEGFTDQEIESYLTGREQVDIHTVNHAGGWTEDTTQPYTLHYRDGHHYVVSNGQLKAITEDQYIDLYADLQDGTASLDSLINAGVGEPGVSGGGDLVTGVDPITGEGAFTQQEDWISLDPETPQVGGQIDLSDSETEPVEEVVEPVEPTEEDTSTNNPDPIDNTDTDLIGGTDNSGATDGQQSSPTDVNVGSALSQLITDYNNAVEAQDYDLAAQIEAEIDELVGSADNTNNNNTNTNNSTNTNTNNSTNVNNSTDGSTTNNGSTSTDSNVDNSADVQPSNDPSGEPAGGMLSGGLSSLQGAVSGGGGSVAGGSNTNSGGPTAGGDATVIGGQNSAFDGLGGLLSTAQDGVGSNANGSQGVGTNDSGNQGTGEQETGAGDDTSGAGDPGIGDGTGGTGGLGSGLMSGLGGGGDNSRPIWNPLDDFTKMDPWKKRRHEIYNSLNSGLLANIMQRSGGAS